MRYALRERASGTCLKTCWNIADIAHVGGRGASQRISLPSYICVIFQGINGGIFLLFLTMAQGWGKDEVLVGDVQRDWASHMSTRVVMVDLDRARAAHAEKVRLAS